MNYFKDKVILVTGGAGSIGSEIVRRVLSFHPLVVRVFDNNETALHKLTSEFNFLSVRPLYGDIADVERLHVAMEGVDIVFHAAAMKHVSICEYNPFEAVKNNVIGTQNVITAALNQNVDKFILISTDKAVDPSNVMGTTKQLAEKITVSAHYYRGHKRTKLSCVRFGNVFNSRGSVVPIFLDQIKRGGPVTVTDPSMTRFLMTIPEAAEFILHSSILSMGKEIFIKKMRAIKIIDLAEIMIEIFAPDCGYHADEIPIKIIGARDGEKIDEKLFCYGEVPNTYENDEMYVVLPQFNPTNEPGESIIDSGSFSPIMNNISSSKSVEYMNEMNIIELLKNIKWNDR